MVIKVQRVPTITKMTLVDRVCDIIDLGRKKNKDLVNFLFEFIESEITHGRRFPIQDVGRMSIRVKEARPGRNPKTGEDKEISKRLSVTVGKNSVSAENLIKGDLSTRDALRSALISKYKISLKQAKAIHSMFIQQISSIAETAGRMEIRGFGSFFVTEVAARRGRNPSTGESVEIDESVRIGFKVSRQLRIRLENTGNFGEFTNAR